MLNISLKPLINYQYPYYKTFFLYIIMIIKY